MAARLVYFIFLLYAVLLFVRVMGSWIPSFQHTKAMRFVAFYTDPYLNIFRRFIPPIGGVIDLSPLIAFIILQFVQQFFISLFR